MIIDIENIVCKFCNELFSKRFGYYKDYKCNCEHNLISIINYNNSYIITFFIGAVGIDSRISLDKIEIFYTLDEDDIIDGTFYEFDDSKFMEDIKDILKTLSLKDFSKLSDYYNYIIKYFINYKSNLIFK